MNEEKENVLNTPSADNMETEGSKEAVTADIEPEDKTKPKESENGTASSSVEEKEKDVAESNESKEEEKKTEETPAESSLFVEGEVEGKKRSGSFQKELSSEQKETTVAKSNAPNASQEDNKAEESTVDPSRPVKRARTAYFIFADEKRAEAQKQHPGEGVAAVARTLGQMWGSITPEEKQAFQDKAAAERERVAKDLAAWKAAGGVAELPKTDGTGAGSLVYPMARIRKICKLDPDVRGLSKEALLLVTKVAEMATTKLGAECVRVAQIQNRRKLLPEDLVQVCATREQFEFLREDIQDLAKQQRKEADEVAQNKPSKSKTDNGAALNNGNTLNAYFGVKP